MHCDMSRCATKAYNIDHNAAWVEVLLRRLCGRYMAHADALWGLLSTRACRPEHQPRTCDGEGQGPDVISHHTVGHIHTINIILANLHSHRDSNVCVGNCPALRLP